MSDADARDGEGYWAHAHWTLLDGKRHKHQVWAQMCNCGRKSSTGHMCKCTGEWVEPDVKGNNKNREGCAPAKQLRTCTLYTHLYNS